jgi:hypothetical protein
MCVSEQTANKTGKSYKLVQSILKAELSMQQAYDNSFCHTSITEQFLVKKQIITIA